MTSTDKPRISKSSGIWHCRNHMLVVIDNSPIDAYKRFKATLDRQADEVLRRSSPGLPRN